MGGVKGLERPDSSRPSGGGGGEEAALCLGVHADGFCFCGFNSGPVRVCSAVIPE